MTSRQESFGNAMRCERISVVNFRLSLLMELRWEAIMRRISVGSFSRRETVGGRTLEAKTWEGGSGSWVVVGGTLSSIMSVSRYDSIAGRGPRLLCDEVTDILK